ncbi:MAG: hypothetical protein MI723_01365, partial [Caulobacterales bacterium]|nr:hypothetical protein [Caulobacterales bacterium]
MTDLLTGGAATLSYQPVSISANTLIGWYDSQAFTASLRSQPAQLSGASSSRNIQDSVDVTPPWDPAANPLRQEELALKVLG